MRAKSPKIKGNNSRQVAEEDMDVFEPGIDDKSVNNDDNSQEEDEVEDDEMFKNRKKRKRKNDDEVASNQSEMF